MSKFPLYDDVVSTMNGNESEITKAHCTTINRLPYEHLIIIYLLILHHYIIHNGNTSKLPYSCRTISNGKGVTFKLDQLPSDIQKIIVAYLTRSGK